MHQQHSVSALQKILEPFLDLCVSSLREGHANLLCIVPILTDVAEATNKAMEYPFIYTSHSSEYCVWVYHHTLKCTTYRFASRWAEYLVLDLVRAEALIYKA